MVIWTRRCGFETPCRLLTSAGQAALLDYLDAQRDYRATEVAYINLVGSYLTAASQLNEAVGREMVQ